MTTYSVTISEAGGQDALAQGQGDSFASAFGTLAEDVARDPYPLQAALDEGATLNFDLVGDSGPGFAAEEDAKDGLWMATEHHEGVWYIASAEERLGPYSQHHATEEAEKLNADAKSGESDDPGPNRSRTTDEKGASHRRAARRAGSLNQLFGSAPRLSRSN
jgi:hypothetical protein